MKSFASLIVLTILSMKAFSQEVINTEQKASETYAKAKSWVALNFKSAIDVIQVDVPNEKLMAKGISKNFIKSKYRNQVIPIPFDIDIIVTFDIKDGKYRYNVQTSEAIKEIPSDERADAIVDSLVKVTTGGGLIGKKGKESMKYDIINLQSQKNDVIKSQIETTSLSIKEYLSKKDNW